MMSNAEEKKVVVFELNEEQYGVDVHQVKSIEKMAPLTRVPRAPHFVKGVTNMRGTVTPVVDLRERFKLPEAPYSEETRLLTVAVRGVDAALIVDRATDVLDLTGARIEPPAEVVGGVRAEYLEGVATLDEKLLILLNLEKVLAPEEVKELEDVFEDSET